jgi:hypothetical protein
MSNNTTNSSNLTDSNDDFIMLWNYLYIIVIILCYDMMIKQYIKNHINIKLVQYEQDRFTDISTIRRTTVNNEAEI